jgi:amidohydrolase
MGRAPLTDVKQRLAAEVDRRRELLIDVSHQVHAHPELNYEEHFAHELLTQVLEAEGLPVVRHAGGLTTAFRADAGTGGPDGAGTTVAVLCEYDALPGIGHACGHNVIAAAGLGAGLAAAALADELGGRLVILGTPAEEGGGGKIKLVEAGELDGVDAALMLHPADADLAAMDTIAVQEVDVAYTGRAAHAAAFPERGRNALDAAVLGYVAVAALRQHIADGERIHGVITDGGDKPNIVPRQAASQWMVRSPTLTGLAALKERFAACLQGGADAAGCEMTLGWHDVTYAEMIDNRAIGQHYAANAAALGRVVHEPAPGARVVGSTDMGNVSYVTPSIHPMIKVAPGGVSIHTPEFARYAGGPEGDAAVVDGAKALAFTVADLWQDAGLVDLARAEWQAEVSLRGR